ncbi:ABC transporter ATP-binding protein YtrB [Gimesia panareensis]|uniref:ABC transporter ATP-binding protein YtrB n=1 Tax=Gimesia panareensis TaxID=2527978 RepID=A0A518FQS3_9PLAN|nr:ABC transporter ATP-binding protein [Gimesia panareensis]QDV18645.1 ABC transporter ATP-binding protein YtrB [Gimesia panareensis]
MNGDKELAVELRGLTKRFGKQLVVDSLDLCIEKGRNVGLLGQNGAGKTTTIKMMMGLEPISSGCSIMLGTDVSKTPAEVRAKVGYVPDTQHIYSWMKVSEVIWFVKSQYPTWNDAHCNQLMAILDLPSSKKVRHLSKGMKAKLALLLAVSHEPDLLILDEPMTGMDPLVRDEFLDRTKEWFCQSDRSVFFSSHLLEDIQQLADDIAILNKGRLIAFNSINNLLESFNILSISLKSESALSNLPEGTVHTVDRAEGVLVVAGMFSADTLEQIRQTNEVLDIEVIKCSLSEIFKHYVQGDNQR